MKKLLTILFIISAAASLHAADVRIVNNVRVDLTPIHEWFEKSPKERKGGARPMPHWKQIKIVEVMAGVPWPACKITADGSSKTVYLKNISLSTIQSQADIAQIKSRIVSLGAQIAADERYLNNLDNTYAEYGSEFDQNRNRVRARLQNNKLDRDALEERLKEAQSTHAENTSDFAMFTGQVYNKLEVWDMGQKQ